MDENDDIRSEELRKIYEDGLVREALRRRFLYSDVEVLLTHGFLTHTVLVNGTALTLRSLTDAISLRLAQRNHRRLLVGEWQRLALASATYSLDYFILDGDFNAERLLHKEMYENMPFPYIRALYSILDGLSRRVARAMSLVEAYSYEPYSRSLWRGISADQQPASNPLIRIWRAINLAEDARQADLMQWEHTRMVVASMSNKAAKHLYNEDKKIQEREKNRRNQIIEDSITRVLAGAEVGKEQSVTVTLDGETYEVPRIMAARSADELMSEMEQVVRGDKDYHDRVVERYKENIRSRFQAERDQRQKAVETAMAMTRDNLPTESVNLVGYTPEQLRELNVNSTFTPRRTDADSSHSARLHDRYLQSVSPRAGWIGVKGVPEAAVETKTGPNTLQSALESRKPTLPKP